MTPTPTAPLRELLAKATQIERAPFDTYSYTERRKTGVAGVYRDVTVWALRGESGRHVAQSDFEDVARACVVFLNVMPAALDELEHLRAERERLRDALAEIAIAIGPAEVTPGVERTDPKAIIAAVRRDMDAAATHRAVAELSALRTHFGTLLWATTYDHRRACEAIDRWIAALTTPPASTADQKDTRTL